MKLKITILAIAMTTSNAYAGAAGVRASYQVAKKVTSSTIFSSGIFAPVAGCISGAALGTLSSVIDYEVPESEVPFSDKSDIIGMTLAASSSVIVNHSLLNKGNLVPNRVRGLTAIANFPLGFATASGGILLCSNKMFQALEEIDNSYFSE